MSEFLIYFEIGLRHILNIGDYAPILFLIALSSPYIFKDWKKLLLLVTIFTLAHTFAMFLAIYGVIFIRTNLMGILMLLTILFTALFHLFTVGKSTKNESISVIGFLTLFFGVIRGLGYANNFKALLGAHPKKIALPILEAATGIEVGQIVVVLVILILGYIVQTVFRFSKRDWTLVITAFVIGVVLPMILENGIWFIK